MIKRDGFLCLQGFGRDYSRKRPYQFLSIFVTQMQTTRIGTSEMGTSMLKTQMSHIQHTSNLSKCNHLRNIKLRTKSIFEFDAINITLGLPFVRISPDHGVGSNIVGKKIANPNSLIESIKFFNNLK